MKNFSLKVFSLIVAALLAYYVHSDTNEGIIGIAVPVELKGLPPDKVVVYPRVRQAQVSIKGPSFLLSQIYASPPSFRVKIPENVGKSFTAVLNKKDLALPPTIEIMRVDPAEMEFKFDKLIKKTVPVQVTQIGTVSEGYKISQIYAEPKELGLSGPQSEVVSISRLETEPIDLREISADTEREVSVRLMAKQSELSSNTVRVVVKVSQIQKAPTPEPSATAEKEEPKVKAKAAPKKK